MDNCLRNVRHFQTIAWTTHKQPVIVHMSHEDWKHLGKRMIWIFSATEKLFLRTTAIVEQSHLPVLSLQFLSVVLLPWIKITKQTTFELILTWCWFLGISFCFDNPDHDTSLDSLFIGLVSLTSRQTCSIDFFNCANKNYFKLHTIILKKR